MTCPENNTFQTLTTALVGSSLSQPACKAVIQDMIKEYLNEVFDVTELEDQIHLQVVNDALPNCKKVLHEIIYDYMAHTWDSKDLVETIRDDLINDVTEYVRENISIDLH